METYRAIFDNVVREMNTDVFVKSDIDGYYYILSLKNADRVVKKKTIYDAQKSEIVYNKHYHYSNGNEYLTHIRDDITKKILPVVRTIFGEALVIPKDNKPIAFRFVSNGSIIGSLRKNSNIIPITAWIRKQKEGIEILGMKPERTKDGKYTYKGCTIGELKEACKKNGLKKYSKMDKCELVKLLMSV